MPPCKKVLLHKMQRTQYLAQMIKHSTDGHIAQPESGWIIDENGTMEIDYFDGNPFPENITTTSFDENEDDPEESEYASYSSADDEVDDMKDSDDDWEPKKMNTKN